MACSTCKSILLPPPLHPGSSHCFNSQSLPKLSFASPQQSLVIQTTYPLTMHTSTFLPILAAASLAAAAPQATSLNDLPACAQEAGLAAIDATGCSLEDISCICNSVPFISTLRSYIEAHCTASDQAGKCRPCLTPQQPPHLLTSPLPPQPPSPTAKRPARPTA
jgi:hypothetical protein